MAALSFANDFPSTKDCPASAFNSQEFETNLFTFLAESANPTTTARMDRSLHPKIDRSNNRRQWSALFADFLRPFGVSIDAWQASSELLCRCLINAENFGKALSLSERLPSQMGPLRSQRSENGILLISESDGSAALAILQLASYLKLFSWLIDEPIPVVALRLHGVTESLSAHIIETMFDCELQIDCDYTAIVVDISMLDRPIVRVYSDLRSILAYPALVLIPWSPTKSISSRVMQLIAKGVSRHEHAPALDEVAFQLGRSSSSLRRQLQQEGTSFQAIKDRWRQERAEHLLQNPANTLEYIASCLGFECTSVFSRAFKSWTGLAPSIFRQAHFTRVG